MIKLAIIVFRESIEIIFLLGIILVITKPVKNSRKYISLGIVCGILLSAIMVAFAAIIYDYIGDMGNEIFDSIVILCTALLIVWTVTWMHNYNQIIRKDITELSNKINAGRSTYLMLIFVVSSTIFREGTEILLFVYSIISTGSLATEEYITGMLIGASSGLITGISLYHGFMKYATKYVFKISAILLTLIAAGLASQAAIIMTSSGIIEIMSDEIWDSSWLASNNSLFGKTLNLLVGYDARPNGMQIIFYFSTILLTMVAMKFKSRSYNNV